MKKMKYLLLLALDPSRKPFNGQIRIAETVDKLNLTKVPSKLILRIRVSDSQLYFNEMDGGSNVSSFSSHA